MLSYGNSGPIGPQAGAAFAATALVIPFPAPRPRPERFTAADRAMLTGHRMQGGLLAGLDIEVTCDWEFGEFASFTPAGQSWSEWNVAPQHGSLALWSGVWGVDLGLFDTMCCVFNTLDLVMLAATAPALQASSSHVPCPHLGQPHLNGSAAHGCSCVVQCTRLSLAC